MLIFEKSGYVLWGLASTFICLSSDCFQVNEKYLSSFGYRLIMFLDSISFYIYLTHLLVANIVLFLINIRGVEGCLISVAFSIILSAALNYSLRILPLYRKKKFDHK
jgi:peptidoglycan/LPS O-acetylase OafA/YrhL